MQRWVLAVIYYSTNGDSWLKCSAGGEASDLCGAEDPFVGKSRFLAPVSECQWAGISCIDGCVTEIEFEENELVGTIPTEIGLLSDLAVWGMVSQMIEIHDFSSFDVLRDMLTFRSFSLLF